jgi:hypothetical protein
MASPFSLSRPAGGVQAQTVSEKPLPVYEIWSRSQGKKVGEAMTLKGATRSIDRRDNEYGGYDHYRKKVGED